MHEPVQSLNRSHAPVNTGAPQFRFPSFVRVELPSGVPVYCITDTSQPVVSISLSFADGAAAEQQPGIARFAMRLLARGAGGYSAAAFADELDTLGASLSCYASWDVSEIGVHVLSDHAEAAVSLMAECVLRPTFDEEETAMLQRQTIAGIQQMLADADQLAGLAAGQTIFAGHPYGHNRGGTIHSVRQFNRDSARSQYNSVLHTADRFFIVAGNCTPDKALQLLGDKFSGVGMPQTPSRNQWPEIHPSRQVVIVDKPDTTQASLRLGALSAGHTHPDYPAVELASTTLGGFFTARLNHILREEKGYTYGAFSFHDAKKSAATLNAATSVNLDAAGESVGIILEQIEKMRREPIPAQELSRARQYLMGVFARNIETPQQVSQFVQTIKLFGLPDSYYTDFFRSVAELNADQMFAAQQRWFAPDDWAIIAVGNAEILVPQLEQFGAPTVIPTARLGEGE